MFFLSPSTCSSSACEAFTARQRKCRVLEFYCAHLFVRFLPLCMNDECVMEDEGLPKQATVDSNSFTFILCFFTFSSISPLLDLLGIGIFSSTQKILTKQTNNTNCEMKWKQILRLLLFDLLLKCQARGMLLICASNTTFVI